MGLLWKNTEMETWLCPNFSGAPQWATKVNNSFLGLTPQGAFTTQILSKLCKPNFCYFQGPSRLTGDNRIYTHQCKEISLWDKKINSYFEMCSLTVSFQSLGQGFLFISRQQSPIEFVIVTATPGLARQWPQNSRPIPTAVSRHHTMSTEQSSEFMNLSTLWKSLSLLSPPLCITL